MDTLNTYDKVVQAVKDYIRDHDGRRPTVQEICDLTGVKSTSNVLYHILHAVENGDLVEEGEPRQSRRFGVPHASND